MSEPALVDCHCHLQDPDLALHLDAVLARAAGAGVRLLVVNGTREEDWPAVLALARESPPANIFPPPTGALPFRPAAPPAGAGLGRGRGLALESNVPAVVPCFGLHPWYTRERSPRWLAALEEHLAAAPSGVGEIGLDRWKRGLDDRAQEECFRAQLALARRLGRPAMVHCVQAWGWLLDVLGSEPPLPAGFLVHAYGGSAENIARLADLGAWFSFAGDTLEERKTHKREAARAVPADRLLVETDAPDMLPPPAFRRSSVRTSPGPGGAARERNEPANLPGIVRGLAALRGESEDRLAAATAENARRFLGGLLAGSDAPPAGGTGGAPGAAPGEDAR